ncbi:putative integral membrane protein [Colletotrichum scovillei]|uniref:Integral membrane protein n=1 Tax=Colletotrichum scovillei TaxID=1209932 RepID=A0A9P7R4V8_9PEZI|nr:putative integral membrane protein [Colletotrichum scovillei]KAG7065435.1 putative integral membrane protein [Colletotrichum scovillei]KAG7068035.1 putative integral membrane protein [Colletotrichum scovillei]
MAPPLDNIVVRQIASLSILFALATGIFGLRLFTRIVHSMTYRLLLDDYCIIVAWILFATQLFLRVAVLNATSLVPIVLLVKRNADMSHVAGVMANMAWSLAKTSFIFTLLQLVTGKLRWLLWFIMVTMNVTVATWVPLFENPCGPRSHLPCMTGRQALNFAVFASGMLDLFSLFGLPPIFIAMEDHMAAAPQHKGQNWYMCGHEHGIWIN